MKAKIPQENPNSSLPPSSSDTFFLDHNNLPLQGEFSMKNGENDDDGKTSLMDAVQLEVEMEKKKIREEIIASDFIRRQRLEAEVRMELMMEKQIMGMRRFYRDLSVFDDPYSTSSILMNSGFLGCQGSSVFHKNLLNVGSSDGDFGDRLKLINTSVAGFDDPIQSNVFGDEEKDQQIHGVPLGKLPCEPNLSLVAAQIAEKSMDGVGEVLGQVMPSSCISGMKRKAETSALSGMETASVANMELQKKKWYCSLCEVSATSAGGLNLHLHGRKHKAKEALSKSCETASNISMDSANNLMQPVEQVKTHVQSMDEQRIQTQPLEEEDTLVKPMEKEKTQITKKWECSLCQVSATSEVLLRSHLQGKKHKAKEAKLELSQVISEAKGKGEVAHKWYCSVCKVSAASEKNLNDHLQGKKHKAKAGLLPHEADSVNSNPIENTSKYMSIVQEKSLEGDTVINEQETVDTSNVKMGFDGDTSNSQRKKQKTSHKEIIETEESEEIGQEMILELVKVWLCKICNEEANDEAAMVNHRKSSKHVDMLRKNGGGLIVVSSMLKEEAVESEKDSQNAAPECK